MNFNFPYLYFKETESTNLVALDLLSKTNPSNGFLLITDYQTAGKGQYGRIWQSERGKNLLFSLILGPLKINIQNIFRLHLASSLALIRSLAELEIPELKIKWPNDIYAGGHKLAGILIQNQLKANVVEWSVIGMGINVNQIYFPDELNATSILLETGIETNREDLAMQIRTQLLSIISNTNELQWDELLDEYNSNLFLRDEMVLFTTKDEINFEGKINSVTNEGYLRIHTKDEQILEFSFGEIRMEKR